MDVDIPKVVWQAKKWLFRHWSGLLATHLVCLITTFFVLWAVLDPLGVPDTFKAEQLPHFVTIRIFWHLILAIIIGAHGTLLLELLIFRRTIWASSRVSYRAHVEGHGWLTWVSDGAIAGTAGQQRRLEAIRIKLGADIPPKVKVIYQAHVENIGWMPPVSDGQEAGTTALAKRLEALRIRLDGAPPGYSVIYQACVEGKWMSWVSDDQEAGTTGQRKRLEAIRVLVVKSSMSQPA